jgi:hypothetical protein
MKIIPGNVSSISFKGQQKPFCVPSQTDKRPEPFCIKPQKDSYSFNLVESLKKTAREIKEEIDLELQQPVTKPVQH